MYTTLFIVLVLAAVLYGLSRTTEKVLAIRHQQREDGKEPIVYL